MSPGFQVSAVREGNVSIDFRSFFTGLVKRVAARWP